MRKALAALAAAALILAAVYWAAKPSPPPPEPENIYGITLTTKEAANSSVTIVYSQDGRDEFGELATGSYYTVQRYEDGTWSDLDYIPSEYERTWTEELWPLGIGETHEWPVRFASLYGELSRGFYRIGKQFEPLERGAGEEIMVYAQFEIK